MTESVDPRPKWRDWINGFFREGDENVSPMVRELMELLADQSELDPSTRDIVKSALSAHGLEARDIMVPKSRMDWVPAVVDRKDLIESLVSRRHTRFPVQEEGDNGNFVGVLHVKDLLELLNEGDPPDRINLDDLIREPMRIPEGKSLPSLLQEFRNRSQHMALVVNEYGDVSGLITMEDVLEQIVGEIADEHDSKQADELVIEMEDGSFQVDPTTPIVQFNEKLDTSIDSEEVESIGGYVVSAFGRVPAPDESIRLNGCEFRIRASDGRRIKNLLVVKIPHAA